MACTVQELREWLATLNANELIGVDDGGLAIVTVKDPDENYFEMGGIPEPKSGTITLKRADKIQLDDLVDLEGDPIADVDDNPMIKSEYMRVNEVIEETLEHCTLIYFEGFDAVGFPPDHLLKVVSE